MNLAYETTHVARRPLFIVADDSPEQLWLVHETLHELGFLLEASDGRELFWLLERCQRSPSLDPVIVIADVHMPVYGGLDVIEAWKQEDCAATLVVMTAFPSLDVELRARNLGASLLPKPFRARDLTRLVQRLTGVGHV